MDYEKETKNAYKNIEKAEDYFSGYSKGIKWRRYSTWKQNQNLKKALVKCNLDKSDIVYDIPCGTGIAGRIFKDFPPAIVASDISMEMMAYAKNEYRKEGFYGFLQSDITNLPLKSGTSKCAVVLSFMHRVPREIRTGALKELNRLTNRYIIVTYAVDSFAQRFKKALIKILKPGFVPAPSPTAYSEIIKEFRENNLKVLREYRIMPILSSSIMFLLEKDSK
ncbi:MAG: class I SAM-dependent methyltransferase [Nitrospinota bacterium]|nr:class I SAM-dependent methyltransferase [Nitrospinota bacterium]